MARKNELRSFWGRRKELVTCDGPWQHEGQRRNAGPVMVQCRQMEESPQGRGTLLVAEEGRPLPPCDGLTLMLAFCGS
jgi:hypothetical protein